MTYSDAEQRRLDQQSGAAMDRLAAKRDRGRPAFRPYGRTQEPPTKPADTGIIHDSRQQEITP